jgi:hypothetical protein
MIKTNHLESNPEGVIFIWQEHFHKYTFNMFLR